MNIRSEVCGETLTVALGGEVDESKAAEVRRALDEAFCGSGFARVRIDLRAVTFMDSTGIGILLGRYKQLHARGIPISLVDPPRAVDRVLSLSGIYEIMPKIHG